MEDAAAIGNISFGDDITFPGSSSAVSLMCHRMWDDVPDSRPNSSSLVPRLPIAPSSHRYPGCLVDKVAIRPLVLA